MIRDPRIKIPRILNYITNSSVYSANIQQCTGTNLPCATRLACPGNLKIPIIQLCT